MAKRFIDSNIFRKDFIRGLDAPYKLFWIYLMTECDHAGFWDVEIDVVKARLKIDIDEETALSIFKDKIQIVNGGSKWFLYDFVEFQYGELNPQNRVHQSVLQIMLKYNIKPLTSSLQGAKDKDKDKDTEQEEDKEKDKQRKKPFVPSFENLPDWMVEPLKIWVKHKAERNESYKETGFSQLITKIKKSFPDGKGFSDAILHSISNNYQGIYRNKDEHSAEQSMHPQSDYNNADWFNGKF